jgi:hypothetical protein
MAISTWDGHSLDDSDYEARVPIGVGNGMSSATANFIDLGQSDPVLSGKTLAGTYYTFQVQLLGSTDADLESQRDILCGWFMPNDFTLRKLVGLDIDNGNKDWYLEGYPVTPPMLVEGAMKNLYNITLALSAPYWIENDLNTDTWNITSGTDTNVITAVGNVPALPIFEITPNATKGAGYKKKTFYAIHTSGWGMTKLPVDITDGGLDTATLVTAGDMLASGDDVRVSVNGIEADRWFGGGGMNSTSTKIWVNLNFSVQPTFALETALNNSTQPATIDLSYTDTAITIPENGTLQIENELFTYSTYTVNATTKRATFTLVERGAKGSSLASHTISTEAFWIENEIWLLYKNAAATPPLVKSATTYGPAFDKVDSTNSDFIYATFGTIRNSDQPAQAKQAGAATQYNTYWPWSETREYIRIGNKVLYVPDAIANPAVVSAIININKLFTTAGFVFFHAGGISNFEATGEKATWSSSPAWPVSVWLTDKIDLTGTSIYNITQPALTDGTVEAISVNEAILSNPPRVYFIVTGGQIPQPLCYAQLNAVTLTIADPPTIMAIAISQENYTIGGTLKNNTTAETVVFEGVITKTSLTLTIDCANQEVYNADGRRVRGMLSFNGEKRDEWMTFSAGANTLAWSDAGTSDVTIVTSWRGRNTI